MDPLARLLSRGGDRADCVVVVAHPDDEVLGCGALLARLPRVRVVHVTDGAPREGSDARRFGFADARAYADRRAAEARAALALAGHPPDCLTRLGVADQDVSCHLAEVARALVPLMAGAGLVLTHAYEGGHSDHDAVAYAAAAALRLGRAGSSPVLVEMPFYRAATGDEGGRDGLRDAPIVPRAGDGAPWVRQRFLAHTGAGPEHVLGLDASERDLKARMLAAHRTQRDTLRAFSTEAERYRAAPRHDFGRLPHRSDLLYERHGWNLTGRLWLERVADADAALGFDRRSWA